MSDPASVVTVEVIDRASPKLRAIPERVRGRLRTVIVKDGKALAALVRQKLSGLVLMVRSGRLHASINNQMRESPTEVYGTVFSTGTPYARIHEFGGQTRPHLIVPVKAAALRFMIGGKAMFARSVKHPGSKIPARSYLRSSLEDLRPMIVADLTKAGIPDWEKM